MKKKDKIKIAIGAVIVIILTVAVCVVRKNQAMERSLQSWLPATQNEQPAEQVESKKLEVQKECSHLSISEVYLNQSKTGAQIRLRVSYTKPFADKDFMADLKLKAEDSDGTDLTQLVLVYPDDQGISLVLDFSKEEYAKEERKRLKLELSFAEEGKDAYASADVIVVLE